MAPITTDIDHSNIACSFTTGRDPVNVTDTPEIGRDHFCTSREDLIENLLHVCITSKDFPHIGTIIDVPRCCISADVVHGMVL